MKANQPYVKEYNTNGEVINEITLETPFGNNNPSNRSKNKSVGKYIIYQDGTKEKLHGNNRSKTSGSDNRSGRTKRFKL